jgi:hypothetical protein
VRLLLLSGSTVAEREGTWTGETVVTCTYR